MAYSNSTLAKMVIKSPNYSVKSTKSYGNKVPSYIKVNSDGTFVNDVITIHHMAGCMSATQCGNLFAKKSRQASSNYGIGNDGGIALYVEECNRAWTSGGILSKNGQTGRQNDYHAVTIEVSNDSAGVKNKTWTISDKAMAALINLVADIAKRNGMYPLKWKNDSSLVGNVSEQNMTVHQWFAKTACPGPYLMSKMGFIAEQANKVIETGIAYETEDKPEAALPTIKKGNKGDQVLQLQIDLNYLGYIGADGLSLSEDGSAGNNTIYALKKWQTNNGLTVDGSYGPKSYAKMKELLK